VVAEAGDMWAGDSEQLLSDVWVGNLEQLSGLSASNSTLGRVEVRGSLLSDDRQAECILD